jgi:hypothetical protein
LGNLRKSETGIINTNSDASAVTSYIDPLSPYLGLWLRATSQAAVVRKRQSSPEFVGLKGAAKKNKVVFTLTEKQFNTIKLRDCYYCGARNTKVAYLHPDKGYIYENSIAICVDCHTARGGMDHDEFLNWLKRVLSFSKTRNFGLERVVPVTI